MKRIPAFFLLIFLLLGFSLFSCSEDNIDNNLNVSDTIQNTSDDSAICSQDIINSNFKEVLTAQCFKDLFKKDSNLTLIKAIDNEVIYKLFNTLPTDYIDSVKNFLEERGARFISGVGKIYLDTNVVTQLFKINDVFKYNSNTGENELTTSYYIKVIYNNMDSLISLYLLARDLSDTSDNDSSLIDNGEEEGDTTQLEDSTSISNDSLIFTPLYDSVKALEDSIWNFLNIYIDDTIQILDLYEEYTDTGFLYSVPFSSSPLDTNDVDIIIFDLQEYYEDFGFVLDTIYDPSLEQDGLSTLMILYRIFYNEDSTITKDRITIYIFNEIDGEYPEFFLSVEYEVFYNYTLEK